MSRRWARHSWRAWRLAIWADEAEIEALVPSRDRFEPSMSAEKREALYAGWREAVARTLFTPETRNTTAHG